MLNRKSEAGLTLIEALISLAILGVVTTAITLVYQQSFGITEESRMRTAAVNLARERLEALKLLDDSGNNRTSAVWQDNKSFDKTVNGVKYTIITSIADTTTASVNNEFKTSDVIPIRVTVQWEYRAKTRQITIDTSYMQSF